MDLSIERRVDFGKQVSGMETITCMIRIGTGDSFHRQENVKDYRTVKTQYHSIQRHISCKQASCK
jgi:hypothetical protein